MAIKWNITAKAMKARGIMDQISAEYEGFITDGSEHLGDVKGLRAQVGDMKDDLYAAANIMGNSGGQSNEPEKAVGKLNGGQAPVPPSIENNAPPASVSPPEVGPSPFQS